MTVARSSVGWVGLISETIGSAVDPVNEAVTLWTRTPISANAAPTWKAGQGFEADNVASLWATPVAGSMPQNPLPTAGSSRKPRPRTNRWRNPALSRSKPVNAPVLPAAGPTMARPPYFSQLVRPALAHGSSRSDAPAQL